MEKVKVKTEKKNKLLTNIPTGNIIELNDLIYEGAQLVCDNPPPKKTALIKDTKPLSINKEAVTISEWVKEGKTHWTKLGWKVINKTVDKSDKTPWTDKWKILV